MAALILRIYRACRTAPAGLLGGLLLAAGIESVVWSHRLELSGYKALAARFADEQAGRAAARCEVLGLGDSQIKLGFDPVVVRRELGAEAYNLAVPGTPPPLALALFERVVRAGGRPRALVVGFMTFGGGPRENLEVFAEALTLRQCLELSRASQDPTLLGMLTARKLLPSLKYRDGIRSVTLALAARRSPAGGVGARSFAERLMDGWLTHQGAEIHQADGRFDGRMEPELERRVYSGVWRVNPAFDGYFRRTAALAAAHEIPVFWLVSPIAPEAQRRRDDLGLDAAHSRNLRAILARTRNVTVLDARHAGFTADTFVDSCHLNSEGSERLTSAVARAVETCLRDRRPQGRPPEGRWVALDPFVTEVARSAGGDASRVR